MAGRRPNLIITAVATVLLAVDGVLLFWVGVWSGRFVFLFWGVVFFLGAVAVVVLYHRYARKMEELRAAKKAMLLEIEAMREIAATTRPATGSSDLNSAS